MATALFLILSVYSLSACATGEELNVNSGVEVERPYIPPPETATDVDVAILLEELDAALLQCQANHD